MDWEDIPGGEEWRDELHEGIDAASAVIVVISPQSLHSDECGKEITQALDRGKRILPVVHGDPEGAPVPDALGRREWIFLRPDDDFEAGIQKLLTALDRDPKWVRTHTRLLNRAEEWERGKRDESLTLRGSDLHDAESDLAGWREGTEPAPTALQREYVAASRRGATRRNRQLIGGLAGALVIAIALGVLALVLRSQAVDREHVAGSRQLAIRGLLSLDSDPDYAMRLALKALDRAHTPEAEQALRLAVSKSQARGALRVSHKPVAAIAVSSAGLTASATAGGRVRVWDPGTGRVRSLHSHRGTVYALDFDRREQRLISDGADGVAWLEDLRTGRAQAFRARGRLGAGLTDDGSEVIGLDGRDDVPVWDAASGRLRTTLPTGSRKVQSIAFDRDGGVVIVTYASGLVQAWDPNRREPLGQDHVGSSDFLDGVVAPDGSYAASLGSDRVDLWDPRTGRVLHPLKLSNLTPLGEAVSDDGTMVAVGYNDNTARIFDARTGRVTRVFHGHSDSVWGVAFSQDGRRLLTQSYDESARVWSIRTGEQLAQLSSGGGGFEDASLSADGRYVATAGHDGVARLWEAAPGRTVAEIRTRGSIAAATLDHSGRVFAAAGSDGLEIASARTGQLAGPPARLPGSDRTTAMAFDPRDDWLAAALGTTMWVINVHDDAKTFSLSYPEQVNTVDWTKDGSRLVAASDDSTAGVIDPVTRHEVLLRHDHPVYQARFLPDGAGVVTADSRGTVRDWRLSDRRVIDQIQLPQPLNDLEVSRDGRVAAASQSGDVELWRPGAHGAARLRDLRHKSAVEAVRFSRDGGRVATAGDDAKARLWDAHTGRLIRQFPSGRGVRAHIDVLRDVDVSPDGRFLITGSADRTARVWDTSSGDQLAVFAGYDGAVFQTRFEPREHALLTVPSEGSAALYACDACRPLDEVVKTAHRLLAVRDVSGA